MKQKPKSKKLLIILIIVAAIVAVTLASTYIARRDVQKNIATATPEPSTSVQSDDSPDRSLQDNGAEITVNFATCTPDKRTFGVSFGSTVIEVRSKDGDMCTIAYGGEVENPEWDGQLGTTCKVPTSLGVKTFSRTNYAVDLSAIDEYCTVVD